MLTLGNAGKDKVTGFKGILAARSQWLTGCDQYLLSPKVVKDKMEDAVWFDEGRIEITGVGVAKKKLTAKKPGGPKMFLPKKH